MDLYQFLLEKSLRRKMETHINDTAGGNSTKRLSNKVVVVTGGARGIGAAAARLFVENGARVVVADILDDLGTALAESIGGRYIHCDVSKEADVESAVRLAVGWGGKLDVMFNNAGIAGPGGSIINLDLDQVNRLISVNVNGVLLGIKHAAKAMIQGKTRGTIICTSSSSSVMGGLGGHAYTLSKAAINGLIRSAACELGEFGIRVNAISPHGVPTEILVGAWREFLGSQDIGAEEVGKIVAETGSLLPGRFGTVDDVARAALFLASEDSAGFVSGQNLVIDGGFTVGCGRIKDIYR